MARLFSICISFCLVWKYGLCEVEIEPEEDLEKGVFQVYRIAAENKLQLDFLTQLWNSSEKYNLDFWKPPWKLGAMVDVMVPPSLSSPLPRALHKLNLKHHVIISDVQRLIETRESDSKKPDLLGFDRILRDDSSSKKAKYDFNRYQDVQTMNQYLQQITKDYPKIAKAVTIGRSHEGRAIKVIKIGSPIDSVNKRAVWVDGGIHAREWAASHVAMYFVHELVTKYNKDPKITHYVDNINWYIAPMVNPDGYEYTRSGSHPTIRLWRKNRSPNGCSTGRKQNCCRGVDLNRNFDFHWAGAGSSRAPCNEVYAGKRAFSEPESRAIKEFILARKNKIDAFITLHTYSQIWVHAFGHKRKSYPDDVKDLYDVGKKAAKELQKLYGTSYTVGSGADTLYPAAGGSDDWAKDKAGIKYVYLLELRPDEREWNGFILDEKELIPTAKETFVGVSVVVDEVLKRRGITYRPPTTPPPTTTPKFKTTNNRKGTRLARVKAEEEGKVCEDKRYACTRWISQNRNLCRTVRYFMREQCSKSCHFC